MIHSRCIYTACRARIRSSTRKFQHPSTSPPLNLAVVVHRRSFASVYAIGESWTGAMGTGRIDHIVSGHFDEEDADLPVKVYQDEDISHVAVGWGHSALVSSGQLLVTGRPHDFSSLLKLRRLPRRLRDYAVRQTLYSTTLPEDTAMDPTSLVSRLVSWLSESLQLSDIEDWDSARQQSFLTQFTHVPVDGTVSQVACGAGLTAILTTNTVEGSSSSSSATSESNDLVLQPRQTIMTFGLNAFGQCGIGKTSNNVWKPTPVTGLDAGFATQPRVSILEPSHPIVDIQLGLQHAVCLNSEGQVFCFGKGDRGQLGQDTIVPESHSALPIRKSLAFTDDDPTKKPNYQAMPRVVQIAAGMLHSAALTEDGDVYVWGKNLLPPHLSLDPGAAAADARVPVRLIGLPSTKKVVQIACGSHHTSVLLDDGSVYAVGVSSDTKEPLFEPVLLVPPGQIKLPARQFASHMDRTTIVDQSGVVLQVHLWKDEEMQEHAVFTPAWFDRLKEEDPNLQVRQVHRSWIHSIIVTD